MDATGVLGVLGLLEDGVHLVDGDHLLALFLETTAHVVDGVVGGVQVAGADEVTNVESIDFAVTLEVVDLEGELDFCKKTKWLRGFFSRNYTQNININHKKYQFQS